MVKAIFESSPEVTPPPGFDAIKDAVTKNNISLGSDGADLDIFTPTAAGEPLPMVLWVHGGGFISSSPSTMEDYSILLANEGYVVASLDYSLAPGARYPAPIQQGNDALRYLERNADRLGGQTDNIVIGGDSAGAQIASQLSALQTNPRLAEEMSIAPALDPGSLSGVVLFCGLYDMDTVGDTGFPALRTYLWSYTGYRDWQTFPEIDELSTTDQITAEYPPTFITVGDADPFATQGLELADRLKSQGVSTTALFWTGSGKGLQHEYQFNFSLPEAVKAFEQTTAFLEGVTR
ncbi:alpha/beta hydrolase [Herbiconiux sp. CPCC 205763]|uniref:Alpha/beta hydrolase n=1 Tax=Herbiconiux aconitum TaxID=2970913 RepID=A0ABT2GND5_9MICO|nr:alpha/beta hydrolase [Herbiconiux aconitum]MCS5717731.1 alpha/beta hydrolase [Herbiconiux aconitum]